MYELTDIKDLRLNCKNHLYIRMIELFYNINYIPKSCYYQVLFIRIQCTNNNIYLNLNYTLEKRFTNNI